MSLSIDGSNLIFENIRVTLINGSNPETGTAYCIFSSDEGFGQLPFLATGESGKPPVFDSITMTEVDPDEPLPSPNPIVIMVSEGGPGVAAHYTMEFFIHKGEAGDIGAVTIATATDLATTPALGVATDGYGLVYRSSDSKWVPVAQRVGNMYTPATLVATAYNTTSPRLLSQISIPPQPWDWYPRCFAQVEVSGSSDTRVDIIARVGDPSSGDQMGFSKGKAGATPPVNVMIPAPLVGASIPGTYGRVAAGEAKTIYLRAEQQAPSSGSWSTPAAPDTTFCVEVVPLL